MQEDMDGDGQYQDEFGAHDGEGDRQYNQEEMQQMQQMQYD